MTFKYMNTLWQEPMSHIWPTCQTLDIPDPKWFDRITLIKQKQLLICALKLLLTMNFYPHTNLHAKSLCLQFGQVVGIVLQLPPQVRVLFAEHLHLVGQLVVGSHSTGHLLTAQQLLEENSHRRRRTVQEMWRKQKKIRVTQLKQNEAFKQSMEDSRIKPNVERCLPNMVSHEPSDQEVQPLEDVSFSVTYRLKKRYLF